MKNLTVLAVTAICICVLAVPADAADLNPSWGPQSGSGMYTLSEVYYYLTEGTEGSIAASFQEPTSGPGGSAIDLKTVYDDVESSFVQCSDLEPGQIMKGKKFFSTKAGAWGVLTGTGGILATGQTTSYRTGDDGDYEKGAAFSYQTSDPAANGEIVVTDNVTGLIWTQDVNWETATDWYHAVDNCEALDFAGYTDWRLPNVTELQSILVRDATLYIGSKPLISEPPFVNTLKRCYWSSTSYPADSYNNALYVHFECGYVGSTNKLINERVRAVRGGE
jgi:hypothetical protein